MKLRRIQTAKGYKIQALTSERWVSLERISDLDQLAEKFSVEGDPRTDMLAVLRFGADGWVQLQSRLDKLTPLEETVAKICLPFKPTSFRDFMLFEKHVIDSTRGYVKRFLPKLYSISQFIEKLTGQPFKRFRPHPLWYKQPIYYLSNHLNIGVSGDDITWPDYTKALDYELELGAVLARPILNASSQEAMKAIGGFVVLNDLSARDVQKDEMESGFGPQKAKHFASTISSVIVTSDEIFPHIDNLSASVVINGTEVSQCHSGGMFHSLSEAVAFASKDENLYPGELFGSGTIPGGAGMENDHWVKHGDTITLRIDRIGEVTNTIRSKA